VKTNAKVIILDNRFKAAAAAASGEQLQHAALMGGRVVEAFAKLNIREQKLIDTGNLVNSIAVIRGENAETQAEVEIGTMVEYAAIHEFGGVIKQSNAFGRGIEAIINIPARPYLRPALDEHETEIGNAIGTDLANAIAKAAA
jgi:phage gpG-like protein